jgi:hypothetical protein
VGQPGGPREEAADVPRLFQHEGDVAALSAGRGSTPDAKGNSPTRSASAAHSRTSAYHVSILPGSFDPGSWRQRSFPAGVTACVASWVRTIGHSSKTAERASMSRRAGWESVIVMDGPKAEYQHPANPRNRASPAPPVSLDFLDPEPRGGLCWPHSSSDGAALI